MTESLDPMRESGIRLWVQAAEGNGLDPQVGMLNDLLREIERLRHVEQGLRTELSVHERRVRLSRSTSFTASEEGMLRFALNTAQQVVFSRSSEFSEDDTKALAFLVDWVNGK